MTRLADLQVFVLLALPVFGCARASTKEGVVGSSLPGGRVPLADERRRSRPAPPEIEELAVDGAVVYRFELLTEVAFGELLVVTIFPDPQGRWFVHSWGRFQDRVVAERREMSAAEVTELRKRIDESGFWKLEPIPEPTPDVRPRPLPRSEIDFTQVRIDGSDLTITVRDPASGTHAARVYVDCSPSRTDVAPPLWRAQVYAFRLSGIPEIVARAAPLSACED